MSGIFQKSDMEKPVVIDIEWYDQILLFRLYIDYMFYLQAELLAVVDGLHGLALLV